MVKHMAIIVTKNTELAEDVQILNRALQMKNEDT